MGVVSDVEVIVVAGDCWDMLMASWLLLTGKSPRRLGSSYHFPQLIPHLMTALPGLQNRTLPWWCCHPLPVPHPCGSGLYFLPLAVLIHLLFLAVRLLAFPLYLLHFLGLWSGICKKCFPYFLVRFTSMYNKQMASTKRELFGSLQEHVSPSGKLCLLEVGCGTGANFKFYPPGCRVTCVDPNPNFEKFLVKSIAENRHLQFERFVVAAGEDMHPVADGSMDVVVCTLVLCSVENQERILQEVCRVLRPVSVSR